MASQQSPGAAFDQAMEVASKNWANICLWQKIWHFCLPGVQAVNLLIEIALQHYTWRQQDGSCESHQISEVRERMQQTSLERVEIIGYNPEGTRSQIPASGYSSLTCGNSQPPSQPL